MPDRPTCATCAFWQTDEPGKNKPCQRHAPMPVQVAYEPDDTTLPLMGTVRPHTAPHVWCGEHRPRVESKANIWGPDGDSARMEQEFRDLNVKMDRYFAGLKVGGTEVAEWHKERATLAALLREAVMMMLRADGCVGGAWTSCMRELVTRIEEALSDG
jgi:hypothetical protein